MKIKIGVHRFSQLMREAFIKGREELSHDYFNKWLKIEIDRQVEKVRK